MIAGGAWREPVDKQPPAILHTHMAIDQHFLDEVERIYPEGLTEYDH